MDEINELQKEWRAIVLDKLTSLEDGQKDLKQDIVDIKTTFVKQHALESLREANRNDIEALRNKVDKLEAFKSKFIGVAIAVQILLEIASHIWFSK
jgi:hypothetical protein